MLKKILIVSSYAPPAIGGPQNLYNLLRDYPEDRYTILTSFYNIDNLSAQKGTWLNGDYVFYDNPKATKQTRIDSQNNPKSSFLNNLKHSIKRIKFIRNILGIPIVLLQIYWIYKTGKKQKGFDTMIGFSDYGPAMIGTYLLHKKNNVPYSIFLFDIYKGNYYPFPGGILSKIYEKRILENAEKIIVTNQGTKDFYINRYNKELGEKIVIIHNSVFPEPYSHTEYNPTPPYKIVFTGRIYWPQARSIKNLIKAIDGMSDVELEIYCPNPKDYLKKIGIDIETKVVPHKEIPNVLKQADILFLPLSWNTKSPQIIDTATPGKLTDYLISSRPMLIHAPSSTALVKYAKQEKFAYIVDQENIDDIRKTIKEILINKEKTQNIINNAKKTFSLNHDANKNAIIFKELFSQK